MEGTIKMWNHERGFGFIEVGDYPNVTDYFGHISQCLSHYEPAVGDCVKFVPIKDTSRGNIVASKIKYTGCSVDAEYFDREKRKDIKKRIELDKEWEWRERRETSESFKDQFVWEKKEGYICRNCHREMDYKSMDCLYCNDVRDNFY